MFTGEVDAASGQRRYFIIGGHNCCACKGGSTLRVHGSRRHGGRRSGGAWRYVDDIGENKTQCAHAPLQHH